MKSSPRASELPSLFGTPADTEEVPVPGAKTSAAPWVPLRPTIPTLRAAMPACRGCELYQHATQVVPGNGAAHTSLLLVGEQPGDQEDVQGLPFVGPAGRVLQRACEELQIDPAHLYITNAVKHFKFVQRGKLRLHQTPRASEVSACRPWLLAEIAAVRPRVVLCLGATAAKSLLGSTFSITRDRGRIVASPYADQVIGTFHPSAILRAMDEQLGDDLFHFLKLDLELAYKTANASSDQPA